MAKLALAQLEQTTEIPGGSLHLIEMGDGSGTKTVTQETIMEETGKALKIGNMEELQTENKTSIVAAINEAAQSGGGGTSVDILDSQEEIEANTEAGKAAGALAVQEMFGALNDNLGGCSLEQEGNDFYIIGADSVRKKLQGNNPIIISQKNIYVISNTPYVGACFVSGYNSLEFNYISATGFEDVSILKIYGQNSDPFESQKGVLLKTITKGNTVYLDITDYDYIYWSGGEKGAFYATCKLTFS